MSRGKGNHSWFSEEVLDKDAMWNELCLTGLRTKWGVMKKDILSLGGFLSNEKNTIKELIDQQYLLENERSYVLSQKGLLFADAISERLFRVS